MNERGQSVRQIGLLLGVLRAEWVRSCNPNRRCAGGATAHSYRSDGTPSGK
jgi:hypothetical protein